MKDNIAFIGPLPPPLGGVAAINENFQNLNYDNCKAIAFNTSNCNENEELYNGFPWHGFIAELKKTIRLYRFLSNTKPSVANIFVTSGYSIIRDCLFFSNLEIIPYPGYCSFSFKKYGEFALKPNRLKIIGQVFNRFTDKIILLSKDHFDYFTNFFPKNKCVIIENFVHYQDFSCEIENKTNDFLYIGRLTKEKGFFDLLEAVRKLKSRGIKIKINTIGVAANTIEQNKINELVIKYEIESYFVFHGAKSGNEKFELFKKSKILLFPSHFENSPVVIKEAIAAKMGIIASDIKANQLIVSNKNNTIFHQSQNSNSLANAIIEIVELKDKGFLLCNASALIKEYDSSVAGLKINTIIKDLVTA